MVDLRKCEPELSYILGELFNMCLKESCSIDCSKFLSVVPVFKNVGERYMAKTYCPVNLLSAVCIILKRQNIHVTPKLVNKAVLIRQRHLFLNIF